MLQHIRAILFDKDGTLTDFNASWAPAIRLMAAAAAQGDDALGVRLMQIAGMDPETGLTAPDTLFASGNAREIAAAWAQAGAAGGIDALAAMIDAISLQCADDGVPVTDLGTLFAGLKARGLKLGIASSDSEDAIRRLAESFGFAQHLDFVAGYDSGHGHKPQPGMLLAFSTATGIAPQHIAMVGDNVHDMAMGRAAGAGLLIGVLTGTGTAETLQPHAHAILPSVSALESLGLPNL